MVGACKKPASEETTGAAAVAESPAEPAAAPEVAVEKPASPTLSPEERAAKLGFARHLPQDTGVVISLHNAGRHSKQIKSSKLWRAISGELGIETEDQPGEAGAEIGPEALIAKELTIAVGPQVGEQTSNLLQLNQRFSFFQMRGIIDALDSCAKSGDFSGFENAMSQGFSAEFLTELLKDPKSGVELFEKMKMPAIYAAFGTTPENRDAIAQQLTSSTQMLGMLGEVVEPVEVEKNGETFSGYKISGAKLSELMASERGSIEAMLDSTMVDRLIAAIAKKDLVVMSGMAGDYAVMFIGSSADDLVLAGDLDSSLVAGEALAFCDAHIAKDIAAVVYGQKDDIARMASQLGGLAEMADGLRDGLAAAGSLGDTRDLQALLRLVGERESALFSLWSIEATGTVAYIEDGLKIESYGGVDSGGYDWAADNRLAGLKDGPNIAVFANATANKAYADLTRSYLEALMETVYAMTMKVAELPLEQSDMEEFRGFAGIFDTKFREDAVAVWNALSGDFSAGLGQESAWVIDLNGSPPPIPGIPQNVVDEGKFPRITVVAPVTERAKLAEAWRKIDSSATSMLGKISEMQGTPIPMQKPLSSERDGYATWFFPLPFFNDDFLPSVTVGDDWFAASTSKNQALDLLAKAGSGPTDKGLTMLVNFDSLREFATLTAGLLEKNADAVALDPEVIEAIGKVAGALEDFEKLTVHCRKEDGTLRSSMHLKTR